MGLFVLYFHNFFCPFLHCFEYNYYCKTGIQTKIVVLLKFVLLHAVRYKILSFPSHDFNFVSVSNMMYGTTELSLPYLFFIFRNNVCLDVKAIKKIGMG